MSRDSILRALIRVAAGRSALRLILILASGMIVTGLALAGTTGKISGKARSTQTKEPLPGVNITVSGTTLGVSTDKDGDYVIANIPPGTYSLKARAVGFREVVVNDVKVHSDETTPLDLALQQTVLELGEEVVITAQRPLVEKDNTASRIVLESAEITSHPTENVQQVLVTLPGISFGSGGELLVRGASLNTVSVLVDGARSQNPLDRTSFLGSLSLRAIEEMNVIRGTFNAEYGEAQTGVFQITTKEGSEAYHAYVEGRYTPPGVKHWGPSMYDPSDPVYWENSHARHPEWWVQYPDQWADPNGYLGNDPRCTWTPEQAYANFQETHKPLSSYDKIGSYYTELGLSGPLPLFDGVKFFLSGNYNSAAPILGNAFRKHGIFVNTNGKITFSPGSGMKVTISGQYNESEAGWGVTYPYSVIGVFSRYAYDEDYVGLPYFSFNAQTVKFTHTVDQSLMYEVSIGHSAAKDYLGPFPGDPLSFEDASGPTYDNLRAVDAYGNVISYVVGYHTLGYLSRHDDLNTEWTLDGRVSKQYSKYWGVEAGIQGTYNYLNHNNIAKLSDRTDKKIYRPYKGAVWSQAKAEFEGFILNAGLRFDVYAPNDLVYLNVFDPLNGPTATTKIYTQLSPRLGIAHPIDEKTVLHFSYGHFFQGPPFGDYGEVSPTVAGNLTTFINNQDGSPFSLGNRALKPEKKVSYEIGLERNFLDLYILSVTAYYQDISNTIRNVTISDPATTLQYHSNGNGDYADAQGVEFYLRKLPSEFYWGYASFTLRSGSAGTAGAPSVVLPDGVKYDAQGDAVYYYNPELKAGLTLKSPAEWGVIGGVLDDLLLSIEYSANFPNSHLKSDVLADSKGTTYLRPVFQNTRVRLTKTFKMLRSLNMSAYVEVDNLFNNKMIDLFAFSNATQADIDKMAQSGFAYTPSVDKNGIPILEMQKYYNLPRSVVFGASIEL